MPYGQEGRTAVVYQVASEKDKRALKVFKSRYRVPGLVSLSRRLAPFAGLTGLQVCERTVLTPQHDDQLLSEHPDLLYAVVMPWIEGPTWMEVLLDKPALTAEQSLSLARALARVLAEMEQESLAHCDLSGPNVLLPMLAATPTQSAQAPVELVDVEQMYGPDLRRPDFLPSGSSGYAHRTAPEGMWSADADRFAGALLLAEMLGWCDERVRDAAWGESYFDPGEMHQKNERYDVLATVLRERWGAPVAGLFEQAWRSGTSVECPTFGEWMMRLPRSISAPAPLSTIRPEVPQVESIIPNTVAGDAAINTTPHPDEESEGVMRARSLIEEAVRLEAEGHLAGAIDAYRQAQGLAPPGSGLRQELDVILGHLQDGRPDEQPTPEIASAAEMGASQIPDIARIAAVEPAASYETPQMASFFEDGLAAYERGDWAAASELLTVVVRQLPAYQSDGQYAAHLLADADRRLKSPPPSDVAQPPAEESKTIAAAPVHPEQARSDASDARPRRRLALLALPAIVLLALLLFGGAIIYQNQVASQERAAAAQATSTAEAQSAAATAQAEEQSIETATADALATTEAAQIAAATGTSEAALATGTVQAQAGATQQAQVFATRESQVAATALAIQVARTSAPTSVGVISVGNRERITTLHTLQGHTDKVTSLVFTPNGQGLASGSDDNTVRLWRVSDGALAATLPPIETHVYDLAFTPDGQTLAVASDDGAHLWNAVDALPLRVLGGHTSTTVAFSPDALTLASGSYEGAIWHWRMIDGSPVLTMTGHTSFVTIVTYSPDGKTLASASDDQTIRLWRTDDGTLLNTMSGHTAMVNGLAFAPDGQTIVSSAEDDTIRMWRVSDGTPLSTISDVRVS
jgi:hypothetical protein